MPEKKDIDALFKNAFKTFKPQPDELVWQRIETALNKDKTKPKVISLWWRLAGAAAVLLLLIWGGTTLFNTPTPPAIEIVEHNEAKPTDGNLKKDAINTTLPKVKETPVVTEATQNKKQETTTNKQSKKLRLATKATSTSGIAQGSDTPQTKLTDIASVSTKKDLPNNITQSNNSPKANKPKADNAVAINDKPTEKPSLLDAVAETLSKPQPQKQNTLARLDIQPMVAPVFYSSLQQGSSLDPRFADNPQKSDLTVSYGLGVTYTLSDKWRVRSGVHRVAVGYQTSDIELGVGPASAAMQSINYTEETVLSAFDKGSLRPDNGSGDFPEFTPKSTGPDALLTQRIAYLEVPLEAQYILSDTKLGLHLTGGFSTLFLQDNEVFVEDGSTKSTLGKVNNLNPLSFTTNLGIGMHYEFTDKLQFTLDPVFKYQLGAYNNNAVEYKPYFIGLYSGFRVIF